MGGNARKTNKKYAEKAKAVRKEKILVKRNPIRII